ncbi:hypothetical protein [Microbacterium hydrocarbonoxydans]|uniref:hypothetical protein n=1 Tax=Microbacterium hydrocarbonoxydans TaxID=273678 RepID=UPI000942F8D2|nr:hypothetical protein [Microbacterium hydrocarbonoxydans]
MSFDLEALLLSLVLGALALVSSLAAFDMIDPLPAAIGIVDSGVGVSGKEFHVDLGDHRCRLLSQSDVPTLDPQAGFRVTYPDGIRVVGVEAHGNFLALADPGSAPVRERLRRSSRSGES